MNGININCFQPGCTDVVTRREERWIKQKKIIKREYFLRVVSGHINNRTKLAKKILRYLWYYTPIKKICVLYY